MAGVMTHREKLGHMQAHVAALGLPANAWQPPLWRLLWRAGIEVPPPVFLGFGSLALLFGGLFGSVWGVVMWLFAWRDGTPVVGMAAGTAAAALMFGLSMAAYFRHLARRHRLPPWSEYHGAPRQ